MFIVNNSNLINNQFSAEIVKCLTNQDKKLHIQFQEIFSNIPAKLSIASFNATSRKRKTTCNAFPKFHTKAENEKEC